MSDLYKLQSLEELMEEIEMGMDIEFFIYGIRYNISWRNNKPFICICPDGEATFFDSPAEMMEKYKVNGSPLKNLWKDFEILYM